MGLLPAVTLSKTVNEPIISVRDLGISFPGKQRAEPIHVLQVSESGGQARRICLYCRSFRLWKNNPAQYHYRLH